IGERSCVPHGRGSKPASISSGYNSSMIGYTKKGRSQNGLGRTLQSAVDPSDSVQTDCLTEPRKISAYAPDRDPIPLSRLRTTLECDRWCRTPRPELLPREPRARVSRTRVMPPSRHCVPETW